MEKKEYKSFIDRLSLFIATGCGVGYFPDYLFAKIGALKRLPLPERWVGSGFLGTCMGLFLALYWPLEMRWPYFWAVLALTSVAILVSDRAEGCFGVKDDSRIIVDEIVGILWVFLFLPLHLFSGKERVALFISAFLLFRIFDVFKWPFKQAQNLQGGLGVVMDDLLAGLFANLLLQGVVRLLL